MYTFHPDIPRLCEQMPLVPSWSIEVMYLDRSYPAISTWPLIFNWFKTSDPLERGGE